MLNILENPICPRAGSCYIFFTTTTVVSASATSSPVRSLSLLSFEQSRLLPSSSPFEPILSLQFASAVIVYSACPAHPRSLNTSHNAQHKRSASGDFEPYFHVILSRSKGRRSRHWISRRLSDLQILERPRAIHSRTLEFY